jgi:3-methyl-2-oxobutanoate hydroxymethyltransferase
MVTLGYENTLRVTMDEMSHHTRAVSRGTRKALLIGDMPFLSYYENSAINRCEDQGPNSI